MTTARFTHLSDSQPPLSPHPHQRKMAEDPEITLGSHKLQLMGRNITGEAHVTCSCLSFYFLSLEIPTVWIDLSVQGHSSQVY